LQFTTPFNDDIRQLADQKRQISQKIIAAHRQNVTVLRSNIFCDICYVLDLRVGGCCP